MESQMINVDADDLRQLISDVKLMKEILLSNGLYSEDELSDWAKKELKESREENEENYVSLENL
ncbi:hypothetical protein KAS08_00540 [Candidatus Pacearchaeota archaeon]|nr:hypothetical protein [Candidatus Pacearchaeota archaeon]